MRREQLGLGSSAALKTQSGTRAVRGSPAVLPSLRCAIYTLRFTFDFVPTFFSEMETCFLYKNISTLLGNIQHLWFVCKPACLPHPSNVQLISIVLDMTGLNWCIVSVKAVLHLHIHCLKAPISIL